jgi:hypothetical protein
MRSFLLTLVLTPPLICSCILSCQAQTATKPAPEPRPAPPSAPGQTFANAEVDAEELAEFLGITIWAFAYDGGAPRCWVEIHEDGQKTVSQPKVLEVRAGGPANGAGGKILLFLRPGNLELRLNSSVSRGGAGISLSREALWWGWKASTGSTTRLERPISLKPGQEVTLLRHDIEEAKETARDPKKPRKVQLLLKAVIEADKK